MNIYTLSTLLGSVADQIPPLNTLPQNDTELPFSFAQLLGEHSLPTETASDNSLSSLDHQASSQPEPRLLLPSSEPQLSLPEALPGTENILGVPHSSANGKLASTTEDEQTPSQHPNNADAALLHGLFALLPPPLAMPPPSSQYRIVSGSLKEQMPFAHAPELQATSLRAIPEYSAKLPVRTSIAAAVITPLQPLPPSGTETSLPPLELTAGSTQTLSPSPLLAASPLVSSPSTTLVNAPTAPLLSAQLGSAEWQQALSQQIIMFQRNGQQSAELRLHPQELGALQITLKLDDNQAQLHIASAQGMVRSAVEAALPHLRQALAEQGINLGQSSVGSDPSPSSSQHSSQQRHSSSYSEQRGNTEESLDLVSSLTVLPTAGLSTEGIDTFA